MATPAYHVAQAPLAYQPSLTTLTSSYVVGGAATTLATRLPPLIGHTAVPTPSTLLLEKTDETAPDVADPSSALGQTDTSDRIPRLRGWKCAFGLISAALSYLSVSSLHGHHGSSHQSCKPLLQENQQDQFQDLGEAYWSSGHDDPSTWSHRDRELRKIPSYVYEYTPYVHLFSGEDFWPCDIANHLQHTTPYLNYTPIEDLEEARTLSNLDELNQYGRHTYLQSNDNVEQRPTWLGGSKNIPSSPGDLEQARQKSLSPQPLPGVASTTVEDEDWYSVGDGDVKDNSGRPDSDTVPTDLPLITPELEDEVRRLSRRNSSSTGGHSSAPALLVVVPKSHGVVDAFWFYFYSYNLGNQVLNVRFGNHVGDWEHSVVRFQHGVPKAMFISEHSFGEAYTYEAMEKIGKRPVIYSAVGTHAMYATPGLHPYVLPWGLLHDETDRGPLWDPLLNHHGFVYNYTSDVLRSSTQTPKAPVSWFNYLGRWGDKIYPMSDRRQYRFAGQYHYVTGPLGPKFKNLGRKMICQGGKDCVIKNWLGGRGIRAWPGSGAEDEAEDEST